MSGVADARGPSGRGMGSGSLPAALVEPGWRVDVGPQGCVCGDPDRTIRCGTSRSHLISYSAGQPRFQPAFDAGRVGRPGDDLNLRAVVGHKGLL